MKVNVVIEKGKEALWGRIEGFDFLPVTAGASISEITNNLRLLIADYVSNEGQADAVWRDVDANNVEFSLCCDLRAFFEEYDFLNISAIASIAGINQSLLRQYAKGLKFASREQAKKVETTIHLLATKMRDVVLVRSTI